jgi:hypothetical protein
MLELNGCVLNLAGLYGGERDPKNWVTRVAKTKDEVKGKKGERQFPLFWSPVVIADSRPEAAQLPTNPSSPPNPRCRRCPRHNRRPQ